MGARLLLLGLDCVPPSLLFDRLAGRTPRLAALREQGAWGGLRSCAPPVTLPAWAVATSGRDPGELGLYGFRERVPGAYRSRIRSAGELPLPRIWDHASAAGLRSVVLFVPPSVPPPPVRGVSAACLLHEPPASWTFPPELATELEGLFGPYRSDVTGHRGGGAPEVLLQELVALGEQHFGIARALWERERPELLAMVEIGPDRLHHALWPALDPEAPGHAEAVRWREAAVGYYERLDDWVGALLDAVGSDVTVLIFSDHGAHALRGGVRLGNLLLRDGWLALQQGAEPPRSSRPLHEVPVDWRRSLAWAEGGHWGRLWLNVAGRDRWGCIPMHRFEAERDRLANWVTALQGPDGRPLGLRVHVPERIYRVARGRPPDLWVEPPRGLRPLGTLGGEDFPEDNDTGPDRCNHDPEGFFLLAGPGVCPGRREGLRLQDVFATAMGALGLPLPDYCAGLDRRAG